MSMLEVRDLTVEYTSDGYVVKPVEDLSFAAAEGEIVVLIGPSGSGKTSVLSCLGGILTPSAGSITLNGRSVTSATPRELVDYRRSGVGIVFQAFNLVASLSARENVAAPLLLAGVRRAPALARADELLAAVGLADRAGHRPAQLSGGQQQRVAIARGLVQDPPLLLADEPTANLDYIQAEGVVGLLRGLRDRGRVIVVSTHDQRLVPIADRVISMVEDTDGAAPARRQVEYAAGETIFEQGSRGDFVYVIVEGEVEISRELAEGGEEQLALLDAGTYFGELGAMLGFPRSATARAITDIALTAYSPREFRRWLEAEPAATSR